VTTSTAVVDDNAGPEFSTVLGGPLYQLFLRLRMVRPPLDLLGRRIVFISLIAWLPLLALSIGIGRAWGGVKVPFLYDVAAQVRFLFSLPLLILAEVVIHVRMRPLIEQFIARDIVAPEDRPRFLEMVDGSRRLRNSVIAEIILLVLVFTGGQAMWRTRATLASPTWYADVGPTGMQLTAAGVCFAYWSLPVYQFILFRWYFRLFIWARFLWQVSRLKLRLIPTHPDQAGGLGFLAGSAPALMPFLVAQSAVLAGIFANRIFYDGARLMQFRMEILALLLFLMALALAPMIVFAPVLMRCQRIGNREYGEFASRYVADFDRKWLRGEGGDRGELLGTGDIQSLADLANSFSVVRSMSPFPFGRATVIRLAVMTALPLAPLLLTVIPFEELVDRLFRSVL
jgi:hypothetical protein